MQTIINSIVKEKERMGKIYSECLVKNEQLETSLDEFKNKINQKESIISGFKHEVSIKDKEIAQLSNELNNLKSNNQDLEAILENNIDLKEKYINLIRKEWLTEKDEERSNILINLENENRKLEQAKSEYKKVCEEKSIAEQELISLNDKKIKLEENISEIAVCLDNTVGSNYSDTSIYRFSENMQIEYIDEIEEINDLLYLLEENFQKTGVMAKYKKNVAQYVLYSVLSGRPLLIFGYNARAFANALSVAVCALPADVLTLPVSFKNVYELKKAMERSKSDIVLIENAVFGCDENIYLQLIKERNKKMLLFSVDFEENISLLPKSMLHFMNMIDLDAISGGATEENYRFGHIIKKLSALKAKDDVIYHNKKVLIELSQICHLTPTYIHQRTNCLSILDSLNGQALTTLLLCELIPYLTAQGKLEELQQFIEEQQLTDNEKKLLEDMIDWK